MTVFAEGARAVAELIAANPNLPVYKMGGGYEDEDDFVLELKRACVGDYWLYGGRVYDDEESVAEEMAIDSDGLMTLDQAESMVERGETPHGRCVWLFMDYAKFADNTD